MAVLARNQGVVLERAGAPSFENRAELVLRLRECGIVDHALLSAFEAIERHLFVEAFYQHDSSEDIALPVACGQTMLAPSLMARMIEAAGISPSDRILEIGTGTGYQSSILSRLCQRVVTLERFRTLIDKAEERFNCLGLGNIIPLLADGLVGYPRYAPFDAIILTGAVGEPPHALIEQLNENGRLVAPVGSGARQQLCVFTRTFRRVEVDMLGPCRVQPLLAGIAEWL